MSRVAARVGAILIAVAVLAAGVSGAYRYGRDYNVHRGFSTLVQLRRAGTGRLESVRFYSPALRRSADYLIYLPPHYNPHRHYPVYYLLHGMPGQPKVFVDIANMDVRLDNQLSLGHVRPMILVYPDGRIGGSVFSDSEWANTRAGAFESYVIEVVHNVDRRFSTIPRRQDRVIAGFSSGAYGAMNIALHHLADFADVQTWSGYYLQTPSGVFAHASRARLSYDSPLDYVDRLGRALARYPVRAYMFVGRDDGSSRQQLPMVRALRAAGAHVRYRFYPGGHDWSVWYPRLNQMLDLASRDLSHPPSRAASLGPLHPIPPPQVIAPPHRQHRSELNLVGALLLALLAAALINLGFVLQHRGQARAAARGRGALAGAFRERAWLIGQGVGWVGFGGAIIAVALAPLTLVQAFSAGSLALSVPLAARAFGHRVSRRQLGAIAVIAVCLVSLPIGFGAAHGHLHAGPLIAVALLAALVGGLVVPRGGAAACAIAAGVFYGVADAAIKAESIGLRFHGTGILTGWTLLAALCTFGGFLAFQAALRQGDAVQPVSLMNAFTALAAVALGVLAFGERLGVGPGAGALHVIAIVAVLACVPVLAGAQQQLASGLVPGSVVPRPRLPRWPGGTAAGRAVGGSVAVVAAVLVCSLTAVGLLYALRQLRWLAFGPRIPDALPLLQLAGFAAQPLARVVAASVLAGLVLGLLLIRLDRRRRLVIGGVLALFLLLLSSDASYALARNLRFDQVLLNRAPEFGAWLEALLLVLASALPGRIAAMRLPSVAPRLRDRRILAPALAGTVALGVGAALVFPGGPARAQLPRVQVVGTPAQAAPPPSRPASVAAPIARPRARRGERRRARAVRPAAHERSGRLLIVWFYSQALHKVADYLVYLPAEYNPARRLPVFYMLHGMPGRPLAFTSDAFTEGKLEALIRRHRVAPMILIFPDGRIDGDTQTDSEWANTRSGRFQSYVVNVMHDVDRRFATLPYRQDRAIAGLSAGAYGAANIGLHEVSRFGLIEVWSGYFIQTRTGVFADADHAQLVYNSPLDYVRGLTREIARYPLRVFLYVGSDDPDRDQIRPMARALAAVGADVHDAIYPGGHSWNLWAPRIDQMLIMASRYFAAGPTASRQAPTA